MKRFEGDVALVTGAGSGIGFEIAEQLIAQGATVIAADLDVSQIPTMAIPSRIDISDERAVGEMVADLIQSQGRIDLLFNNAGIGSTADPISCTAEEWDRVFAVNVRGVFLATRAVLPHMLDAGRGAIINTASVAGMIGLRNRTAYCASKGAVIALTKQVAIQYAGTGIRCNAIAPGTVDSPWVAQLLAKAPDPVAERQALTARQPVRRLGKPSEIAFAALYLASRDADFITGETLVIDGGIVAG